MRILVIGSGAREHALAWRLERDGVITRVAPGNGGTPANAPIPVTDIDALARFAVEQTIDLTVVGPEAPLAAGIVDAFSTRGLKAFGPSRAAACLESSKAWAKDFLRRHGIPTGHAEVVADESTARREIERFGLPVAIKADGLAAGKGVHVALTPADVEHALDQLFRRRAVGAASDRVLIEEYLEGPELSVLAFTDGEQLAIMPPARDYKRVLDADQGPNTGGMGGYTWPTYATGDLLRQVEAEILRPTIQGMAAEGTPYRGVLYAGLMLTSGGPRVIEFNCRFGDPEAQLILPLLDSSLVETCASIVEGGFQPDAVRWRHGRTFGVVLATAGYPESPRLGDPIGGLGEVPDDVQVFHAGTALQSGQLVTVGGRVATLVGSDRATVYEAASRVSFEGKQYRRDIAHELLAVAAP